MNIKILFAVCLSLLSLTGYAADNLIIRVDARQSQFVVKLPANPTTGYQWQISAYDKKLLKLQESHYEAAKNGLMGAGGEMIYTFALNKVKVRPQETHLSFTYARSWEPKSGTSTQVTVMFGKAKR